ncbi:MAG: MFS transporter [Blastopirellula sp.]|nr:MAG: MFS transporter [Blastopirellula sp.]
MDKSPLTDNPSESANAKSMADDDMPSHVTSDIAFWGMTGTQGLGAFNDNMFKQLLLLLLLLTVSETADYQSIAMLVFALPFLLFSGPAGFLADKYSKRTVVILSKVAEIVAMALGVVAFYYYETHGFAGLFVVLFLMGLQSTFFAPAKYGILPEMLHEHDLPKANGIFLMITFLAIIFGTVAAGAILDNFGPVESGEVLDNSKSKLWIGSGFCVLVAILGTGTSLLLRKVPASTPNSKFSMSTFAIPKKTVQLFRSDFNLLSALLASCAFWLCAGVVFPSVNSLGIDQLDLSPGRTSILSGSIGAGIALGCLIAGLLSRGKIEFRLVRIGSWGIIACLVLMALPGSEDDFGHLLGFYGSLPVLILLGVFTGFFSVPIQVYLQAKAPEDQKGQVIAEMSRANWVAIFMSGLLYGLFDLILNYCNMDRCWLFAFTAVLMLPVALIYHPKSETLA